MNRSEKTRNDILVLVDRHVFKFGFASLTMEQAAECGRVSKRTLYKYFPNKEALLEAMFRYRFAVMSSLIESAIGDGGEDWFLKYSRILMLLGKFLSTISPVLMRDLANGDPRYWSQIRKFRQEKVFSVLSRIIRTGRDRGDIRTDLDAEIVTSLFISIIDDIASPNRLTALPYSTQEVISTMVNILFNGILSEAGRERFPSIRLDGQSSLENYSEFFSAPKGDKR